MSGPLLCPDCDGELAWVDETATGHQNDPNGTGFLVLWCAYCDKGFSRFEVGL